MMEAKNQTADYLPWDEFKRLINSLYEDEDYQYCMILVIGVHFGLRISDIKSIRWEDIISNERIIMKEKKTRNKKGNYKREIPVNKNIKNFTLDIYQKMRPRSKYIVTTKDTQSINQKFMRLKEKYNLQVGNFTTHSLRKTFGRRYLETNNYSGKALIMLNEIFNHVSISDTKRYLGIRKEEMDEVYEKVGEKII